MSWLCKLVVKIQSWLKVKLYELTRIIFWNNKCQNKSHPNFFTTHYYHICSWNYFNYLIYMGEVNNHMLQYISFQLFIQWHHISSLKVVHVEIFTPHVTQGILLLFRELVVQHLATYHYLFLSGSMNYVFVDFTLLFSRDIEINWKSQRASLRKDISWVKLPILLCFFCLTMWYLLVWKVLNGTEKERWDSCFNQVNFVNCGDGLSIINKRAMRHEMQNGGPWKKTQCLQILYFY